ncbi:MAG: PQQ-dependent sugar dehydrogenase [Pseudomonadota bacterium]
MNMCKTLAVCGVAIALAGCGGGGSDSAITVPLNTGPAFTSSAAVSVQENSVGVFYTAAATDPDGDAVTVSISGGEDAALIRLDATTGGVSFSVDLDFENPSDSNQDNVYEVTLQARDSSGATATLNLDITVTDQTVQITSRRVGTGLSQPLGLLASPDGSGRVLVVQKGGRIRLLSPDTGALDSVDFLDVSADVSTDGERGLLGLAMSPDFANDRGVYVHMTNVSGDSEIRRYEVFASTPDQVDPSTETLILRYPQPLSNHNAGWIGFNADGLLIIPTGDGGGSGDPNNLAQNPQSLLGKVLRLDVSRDDFPSDPLRNYAIPTGNTFNDPANGRPEIYAMGLRNPFQSSFDPISGDVLLADVGQDAIEEVSRLPMDDSTLNFGWAVREGTAFFKGADQAEFTPPVLEYGHGDGPRQGRSITGGLVYQGPVEALQNHYVFADFISDNIWAVPVSIMQSGQTVSASAFSIETDNLVPDVGTLTRITAFGTDEAGNLYIVTIGGDIFQMVQAP